MSDERDTFLYVIARAPEGPCKVGHTKTPLKRLINLQGGNPYLLNMHGLSEPLPYTQALILEYRFVMANMAKRLVGEWFSVSVEEARASLAGGGAVLLGDGATEMAEIHGFYKSRRRGRQPVTRETTEKKREYYRDRYKRRKIYTPGV